MKRIDWNEQFKIRLSNNPDEPMDKHDVVKILLVRKLIRTYKRKNWIRIYTEHDLETIKPDIYFENIRTKEVICYEIQKQFTKKWLETKTKQYNELSIYNFKVDFIPINLNDLSDNINELKKQLDKYIF